MRTWQALAGIWLGCAGVCVGCAGGVEHAVSPWQRAERLQREGRHAKAYAAFTEVICSRELQNLELLRQFVAVWDALGRPGRPGVRLTECGLQAIHRDYLEGLTAAVNGRHADAARHFRRARADAAGPRKAELSFREGRAWLRAGTLDAAGNALQQAESWAPARADIRIERARWLIARGQLSRAARKLQTVLGLEPTPELLEQARQVLHTAVRRAEEPLTARIERQLSTWLTQVSSGEVSEPVLLQVLALADRRPHPRILTVAGMMALQRGAREEGRELLLRAAEMNPLDPDPLRTLGIALHAAEQEAEAVEHLHAALKRDPFDVAVAQRLAEAANAMGEYGMARDAYRSMTVLQPQNSKAYLGLARMARRQGALATARQAVRSGCRLAPKSVPLLLERAVVEASWAQQARSSAERDAAVDQARNAVDELLEVAPRHPGATTILADLEALQNRPIR